MNHIVLPDGSLCLAELEDVRYRRDHEGKRIARPHDRRTECERDVGRLRYSTALMRLSGITQVTTPDPQIVRRHDRLTHTLKVAGLAREIAGDFVRSAAEESSEGRELKELILSFGGLDISACEAGGLAHDLGHAPFAHSSQKILDKWLLDVGDSSGFEGNAQSLRVLRKLEARAIGRAGLDLTALSLGATLKYPWIRDFTDSSRAQKFSVYHDDVEVLELVSACSMGTRVGGAQTLEAAIVEVADDITYALHDLQDFVEAGLIDLASALASIDAVADRLVKSGRPNVEETERSRMHGLELMAERLRPTYEDYSPLEFGKALHAVSIDLRGIANESGDSYTSLAHIRETFSRIIRSILKGLQLNTDCTNGGRCFNFGTQAWNKLHALKLIGRYYAIENASVARQERSNQAALRLLLEALLEWAQTSPAHSLPRPLNEYVQRIPGKAPREDCPTLRRAIVDYICGMTDRQCLRLASELNGGEMPVV